MTEHQKLDLQRNAAPDGRVDRLERQGLLHRARALKSPHLFSRPLPQVREGASALEALLEERRSGW